MRHALKWVVVVVLCCATGAGAGEAPSDSQFVEARTALDEAKKLQEAGKYLEAIAPAEHALALTEAALGKTHPQIADCLQLLGALHLNQGEVSQAEPLYLRALEIREAALGKNHPDIAALLNGLGKLYSDQGRYERAEPLLLRALEIQEGALGKNHLDVAGTLNNLANLYLDKGLHARAEPLFKRALEIREAGLGKNHPLVGRSLSNLANLYERQGLYGQAEPLYQRALALFETALGKNHPDVAFVLNNLGAHYFAQGLFDKAIAAHERALAIREASLGRNHPLVATSLGNLASVYAEQGFYDRAVALHERELAIKEEVLGKEHPSVAVALSNLSNIYVAQGAYGQAEPLLQRALVIEERALGKSHPDVANMLNNLGGIYREQGMYSRAAEVYERALAIWESALGAHHPRVAYALTNLAVLYTYQELYAQAEPLLQRAVAIREEALGKKHPDVAASLDALADVYKNQALYDRARPLYERAFAIYEAVRGKRHTDVARTLHNLGELYWRQGLYARAEPLLQRSLAIWKKGFGGNHRHVATSLSMLANVRLAQHRLPEAIPLLTDAFAISERRLRQEGLGLSEARLAGLLQILRTEEEDLYALLQAHPEDLRVRRLALTASLLLKSRSTEESADTSRTIFQSLGAEDRELFARLRGLRTQLATLSFQGPGPLSPADYQHRLKEIADAGDALEADLARRSAPLRALTGLPPPSSMVEQVAAALPKEGALVEFIAYTNHPLVPKAGTPQAKVPSQPRYLALVLLPDASIRTVDLGPSERIDSAASRLRDALGNRDASFQSLAQELYKSAFQPLLPLLGERHRLFLSPDGQLALVPFAALHDGRGFLVDTYDMTYLISGKELLPRFQDTAQPRSIVVLADPDFSAPVTSSGGKAEVPAERSPAVERFHSLARASLVNRQWTALPGTRKEAEAIQRMLPQAQLFLGAEASKERLLHLPTPGVLHLATHGFFLDDAPPQQGSRAVGHFGALGDDELVSRLPDPLLRSGLALAGARASASDSASPARPPSDSALVTALELAGLNLWGTELVVLSACDTGRGEVQQGQGVSGLRRAFLVAGAETVVMSLWKVDDEITQQLMEAYYRQLLDGQGRAAALREAMREMRATQPHPHYWAPFIAVGQDTPLRALAPSPQEAPKQ